MPFFFFLSHNFGNINVCWVCDWSQGSTEKDQFCYWGLDFFQYYLQLQHRFRKMLSQNHLPTLRLSFPTEEEVCYVI